MPFKNPVNLYKAQKRYRKRQRELLKDCVAKQKLKQDLTKKMILFAREFLQERQNYPIEAIPNCKYNLRRSKAFMIGSEDALKSAVKAICKDEDEYIRGTPNVSKIGVVQDLQISLLNETTGLVWEIVVALTEYDLNHLEELI